MMGHDMALADFANKSAIFGYKERWLLDIAEPITPETIRARALVHAASWSPSLREGMAEGQLWDSADFAIAWASRPGRGTITAHHEPIFQDDSWPWEREPGWDVVDMQGGKVEDLMREWGALKPLRKVGT